MDTACHHLVHPRLRVQEAFSESRAFVDPCAHSLRPRASRAPFTSQSGASIDWPWLSPFTVAPDFGIRTITPEMRRRVAFSDDLSEGAGR
jgi:hypothetical protein